MGRPRDEAFISRVLCLALSAGLAFSPVSAFAEDARAHRFYRVAPSDTLSGILYRLGLTPIYGESGSLSSTLALNPGKRGSNGDLLRPGERIALPLAAEPSRMPASPAEPPTLAPEAREAAPAAREVDPIDRSSSLFVAAGAEYFRVDSVDRSTGDRFDGISNLSPSVEFGWKYRWDERWTLGFSGGLLSYSFEDLRAPNSFSDGKTGVLGSAGIGAAYSFSDSFDLRFGFGMAESLFFYATGANSVAASKSVIGHLEPGARWTFLRKANAGLGLLGAYRYSLPGSNPSLAIRSGSGFLGGLFFRHEARKGGPREGSALEFRALYRRTEQDTSITEQEEKSVLLQLRYEWGLEW